MVQSRYSHIVRVFIADRFYREAKQLARDERNEKFCRLRTNREILSVCARCPLRLVFSVAILPWSSDTRWRSSERGRRRKQEESAATRARDGKRRDALFPSLFPQTFPAAPLLPNRFFHRDRTCVFCVRGGYRISDPGNFPRILRIRRVQRPHSQIVLTLIPLLKTLFATTRVLFDSYRCTEITILLRQWRESFSSHDGFNRYVSQKIRTVH